MKGLRLYYELYTFGFWVFWHAKSLVPFRGLRDTQAVPASLVVPGHRVWAPTAFSPYLPIRKKFTHIIIELWTHAPVGSLNSVNGVAAKINLVNYVSLRSWLATSHFILGLFPFLGHWWHAERAHDLPLHFALWEETLWFCYCWWEITV